MMNVFESTALTKLPFKCSFYFYYRRYLPFCQCQGRVQSQCQGKVQSPDKTQPLPRGWTISGPSSGGGNLTFPSWGGRFPLLLPQTQFLIPHPHTPTPGFPPKLKFIIVVGANTQIHMKNERKWDSLARWTVSGDHGFLYLFKNILLGLCFK